MKGVNDLNVKLIRRLSQITVVGLLAYIGIRHQILGGGPEGAAPLDSYCAFGGVETAFQYIKTGTFITKTNFSNFIILGAILLITILAGSAFCSWLCPLGAVQEFFSFSGKKIFRKQFSLPAQIDHYLRYMRYVVLAVIIFFTYRGATLVFEEYDPLKALFHFKFETTTAYVVLALTVIISFLIDRAWCKYFCPLGGLISIFGRFNFMHIKRNDQLCAKCGLCSKNCPANIEITEVVTTPQDKCIKCLDCMQVCPVEGALELQLGGGKNESK